MEKTNNIVIISDNKGISDLILSKINLVRGSDVIETYNYSNAITMLYKQVPEMIVIYADIYSGRCFDLIGDIKLIQTFAEIPVLLVCEKIEQDFILNAFDEGISDYISLEANDTEFLMRIIWCLQKSNLIKKCSQNMQQLINLDVVYPDNYFYKEVFVDKIFQVTIKNILENKKTASLMILTPDIDYKQKLSPILLGSVLKKTLRSTDIVGIKEENKFYILLNGTKVSETSSFFSRLKEELSEEYSICAGAVAVYGENFEELEKCVKMVLQDAMVKKGQLIVYSGECSKNGSSWQDASDMSVPHKNFKLFKQSFIKKVNNVITPVFYQVQKMYEEKLFQTKIDQVSTEGKSIFSLTSPQSKSTLTITYPGFSKINISTTHNNGGKEENNMISLNLSEVDNLKLTMILEKFIKEYKNNNND